ncbi:MAG TPA: Ig-like domain repeat protein, partial [Acidobacteriaceae bacterium]|nr:Ig-like domain repeat protein [Acidobacteriaceae bacterium]
LLRYAAASIPQGASATATTLASGLTSPSAVAVDARGYAYVADSSTGLITQVSPAGVASTLSNTFAAPDGLAVDALNNLYVADSSAQAVYQVSPITGAQRTLALGTLVNPAGLAVDPSGNLLVTDPGASAVYRFNLQSGARTAIATPATQPSAVATDAAGNLLIADSAAIDAVPAGANSAAFTAASVTPAGLAIDSAGNIYTGQNGGVLKLVRTQGNVVFATVNSAPQTAVLLNSGNQSLAITSAPQTDTVDYSLSVAGSTDCTLTSGIPTQVAVGGACAVTATYTPTTYAATTDTVTVVGNLSNAALSTPALVQLTLSGPATAPAPAIQLGAFSPASPVYGQTVSVTATVTGASLTPAGSVAFSVDSGTATNVNLNGGAATGTFAGLGAGTHTVTAVYTSTNGYASVTTTGSVTIAQASQTINFATISSPVTLGVAPITLSATGGASGNPVTFSVLSGPGSIASGKLTVTGAGTIVVAANQAGNANYAAATQVTQSVTVNKAAATIALQSSANPSIAQSSVTFTATVSSTAGAPSGSVSFLDGTTVLGSGMLSAGVATFSTSSLAGGPHSITAVYSGDSNYAPVTSAALAQNVADFSISAANSTLRLPPGHSGTYTLTVTPVGGSTFPNTITLSLSGLPPGASYTFAPAAIPGGSGTAATLITLTVQLPNAVSEAMPLHINGNPAGTQFATSQPQAPPMAGRAGSMASFALAVLLLPFAGAMRRHGRRLGRAIALLALVAAGLAAAAGMTGCGADRGPPQTYTLTVTGTSGSLAHTTTLTLTAD